MGQELTNRVFIALGQASVIAVIAGVVIHGDIDSLKSAVFLDFLAIALSWTIVQVRPSPSLPVAKRRTAVAKPIGLLETVIICGIPIALAAFLLGALYGGASHAPHFVLTLLCAPVGAITGRTLGEIFPLRRMLGRFG